MTPDTRDRVNAFRQALELAANEPVLYAWRNYIGSFPDGCCELSSQTLVKYLIERDDKLFPYVIAMEWEDNSAHKHGHVIVALDGEYIDLTLDQFDEYDTWIVAEPIESGGQVSAFLQKIRNQGGTITTRKLTLEGIPDENWKLYDWLKDTADNLLAVTGQQKPLCGPLNLVSTEILTEYDSAPADKSGHASEKKPSRP